MIEKLNWLYTRGFVHIMGSGLLSKVFTFIGNVFVVRILTKGQYGTFGYVDNIMSFFLILAGLGMNYGVLQYCSENRPENQKQAYYKFGIKFGIYESLFLVGIIFIVALVGSFTIDNASIYLMIFSFYPVCYYLYNYANCTLRYKKKNKEFAITTNVNAAVYAFGEIICTYLFGTVGIIIALYLSMIVSAAIGFYFIKIKYPVDEETIGKYQLSKDEKIDIIKYSAYTCANTMISNLLIMLDVFFIGLLIAKAESIAAYKVASIIPLAIMVIPNSLTMFVYPYFAEHNKDYNWMVSYTKKLFLGAGIMNLAIASVLFFGAPLIIKILWGSRYLNIVWIFRILSINYFITATFRGNMANILAAMKKVRANFHINIIAGLGNIVLDYWLISKYGSEGAAWATVLVVILTTTLLLPILVKSIKELKSDNGEV